MDQGQFQDLLDDVFEEEALAIGGLAVIHTIDSRVIDDLMSDLAEIRRRALKRLTTDCAISNSSRPPLTPHPAISRFLTYLGRNGQR